MFLFPKGTSSSACAMPMDKCLHKFGFSDIYMMYFKVHAYLYENPSFFVHSSRMIHERQASMDE